jgi:hypothetical protein
MDIRPWAVAAMIAAVFHGVVIGQEKANQAPVSVCRISGRIVDRPGVPVRNQPVLLKMVRSLATSAITSTDQDEVFTFAAVAAASYEIILEVPGFRRLAVPVTVTDGNVNIGTIVLEVRIGGGIEVTPYPAPASQSVNASQEGVPPSRQFRGRYANIDYGFSVEIPAQVVGEGTAAPAPNHGFAIRFDEKSVLLVDASYDVTEPPHRFGRSNARLGTLKAERKTWKTTEDGREKFHQEIIARGFDRGSPIIYTIQVDTTAENRDAAYRIFEAIVKSFRTFRVSDSGDIGRSGHRRHQRHPFRFRPLEAAAANRQGHGSWNPGYL